MDPEPASKRDESTPPTRADPGVRVAFSWAPLAVIAFCLAVTGVFLGPTLWADRQNQRILREGAPATARIKDIRPTGNTWNDQPEVTLILEVQVDGGEPFQTDYTTFMNQVYLPRYQPGAMTEVRIDPKDSHRVAIVEP